MSLKSLSFLLGCAGVLLTAVPAEAQLYRWQDASGRMIVSDRPLNPAAQTYAVPGAKQSFRSTRPVVSRRAQAYDELIDTHASAQNVDPNLVRAVIQAESAFNPRALSPKGAMGLMQLMPATAIELGVANAYDPAQNIRGGVAYLKQLLGRYNNDVDLALAAYNAGITAVAKYGGTVPPYRETRNYVSSIRRNAGAVAPAAPTRLYKITEVVDGQERVRYSNTPADGAAIVTRTH
jgi:soluble lytic murein transglycosylase-like protein